MKILQHPRGSKGVNDAYVGDESQITVDMTGWEIRLHDGITPGGHRLLNLQQLLTIFLTKDSEFGNTNFAPGDRGWLTRVGHKEWALRAFTAGTGIQIIYPQGYEGNPVFNVRPTQAMLWAGVTQGDDEAFVLPVVPEDHDPDNPDSPPAWQPVQGGIFLCRFHESPANSPTMSVNGGPARSLICWNGDDQLSHIIKATDMAMIAYIDDHYVIMTAGANASLTPGPGDDGGPPPTTQPPITVPSGMVRFDPPTQALGSRSTFSSSDLNLEPGDARLVGFNPNPNAHIPNDQRNPWSLFVFVRNANGSYSRSAAGFRNPNYDSQFNSGNWPPADQYFPNLWQVHYGSFGAGANQGGLVTLGETFSMDVTQLNYPNEFNGLLRMTNGATVFVSGPPIYL